MLKAEKCLSIFSYDESKQLFVTNYIFYFILGYKISRHEFKKNNRILIYVLGVIGFAFTISRYNLVEELTKEENVIYIDGNLAYDLMGLSPECFEDAFSRICHFNERGANIFTEYIIRSEEIWQQILNFL